MPGAILPDHARCQAGSRGCCRTLQPTATSRRSRWEHDEQPGIKVDTGAIPLAHAAGELITEGLDGLRERLAEYHHLGARFAKWRAVITIADGLPSSYAIAANAHALARYAALCQEAGIVPIVEPEVLMDGTHPIERSEEVTREVLRVVFAELLDQRVRLEGIVLKARAGRYSPALEDALVPA